MKIILYGQTPSKKNSHIIVRKGNKNILLPNKLYTDWLKRNKGYLLAIEKEEFKYPVYVEMFFYRESRRRWDYNNIGQSVLDALVKYNIIEDDDTTHCIPIFKGYEIDKDNARVEIEIKSNKEVK